MTPLTATWPRDGSRALASSGNPSMVEPPVLCTCASKQITGIPEAIWADVLSAIAPLLDADRDFHGSQASCGSACEASRFLTGLVTCLAAHGDHVEDVTHLRPLAGQLSGSPQPAPADRACRGALRAVAAAIRRSLGRSVRQRVLPQ